jgi:D-glycero-D-manno-heptose 1,7-bisphosphate phosphatase
MHRTHLHHSFVLLDRDGVLNVNRAEYVRNASHLEMTPTAGEACRILVNAGFRLLVVTNQAGIGKGLISEAALNEIHDRITAHVRAAGGDIHQFYVCPHRNEDACGCRKPKPGLLERAQREHGFDLAQTWMVGDSTRDMLAAQAAGCKSARVTSVGHAADDGKAIPGVPHFNNLLEFALFLVSTRHPRKGGDPDFT